MLRCLIQSKMAADTIAVEHVASGRTIIDKFTATNTGAANVILRLYLVPAGASASPASMMAAVTIGPGKTYLCGEVVGHALDTSDQIAVEASLPGVVAIRASGRDEA